MRTFVLVGGDINSADSEKDRYYSFLSRNLGDDILIIPFARDESEWITILENTKEELADYHHNVNVEIASTDVALFKEQIEKARTIIIRGGSTDKLVNTLGSLNFAGLNLDGKTISGNSAGAYALSRSYYSLTDHTVKNGLGLVNCNVVVHYKSSSYRDIDWAKAVESLGNDRPTLLIPERTFCVVTD